MTDSHGREINHQYSKSLAFEQAFRGFIHARISPNLEYFSLLRPYAEIAIARRFAEMREYHHVFSSCNRNFHQEGPRIAGRWCRDCPKCRFAALALAPFITVQQLTTIQGGDLLDREDQIQGYKALCGLGEHKPFDCVGSIAESRAAMKHLASMPAWRDKTVVKSLSSDDDIKQADALVLDPDPSAQHCIPTSIMAKPDGF